MPGLQKAAQVLENDFLITRNRILDVAAALDRIDRSADVEQATSDPRFRQLKQALGILIDGQTSRAQRVQMVFSREYDSEWRA